MAQSGYKIFTTRAEKYTDSPFEFTGAVEANTEFLPDGTTPDPNYVIPELNTGECPINPPPAAPTNLVDTNVEHFQFNLSWTASSGATGYKIYKNYVLKEDVGNVVTDLITSQTPGIGAIWTVVAYNAQGDSLHSESIVVNQLALQAVDISDTGYDDEFDACASGPGDGTLNKYHDGAGTYPTNNDVLYDDVAAASTFNGSAKYWYDMNGDRTYEINSTGKVLDDIAC